MIGNTDMWYGLSLNGEEQAISHDKLMEWAYDNNFQFTVGWTHTCVIRGVRLVRGPKMLEEA